MNKRILYEKIYVWNVCYEYGGCKKGVWIVGEGAFLKKCTL